MDGILGPEEQQSLEELHQYMLEDEGSWALGDGFLNFVGQYPINCLILLLSVCLSVTDMCGSFHLAL